MTSEHLRETIETIDWSTVCERGSFLQSQKTVNNGESSMTSEHAREMVKTIDRFTVHEHGSFLECQKTVTSTKLHLYKESGNAIN